MTVELKNFRPATVGALKHKGRKKTLANNPTDPIRKNQTVLIGLDFPNYPPGVYDYDVYVDGTRAADPQLEL